MSAAQPYRPPVQTRVMKDSHGSTRTRVRYEGQSRWYRGLANAQIAHARGRDTYPPSPVAGLRLVPSPELLELLRRAGR